MPFDEYLKLPGYSFSFLKRERSGFAEDMAPTAKIEVGKLVDAILCEPATVRMDHPLYPIAKAIAFILQQQFGPLLARMRKQTSYTCLFTANGWSMPFRGRPDFELPVRAIVDLKITSEKKILPLIEYMQYWDQQYGYAKAAGVPKRYILIYSRPNKEAILLAQPMTDHNDWWAERIERFGWPAPSMPAASQPHTL
jgi:hypothetical protein